MSEQDIDTRELPEGETRKQVLVHRQVREYIKERKKEDNKTYSQQMAEWLPQDVTEETPPGAVDDIVPLKLTAPVHGDVSTLASGRLRHSQVVAYYAFRAALENNDYEAAAKLASVSPTLVLREMMEDNDD
jgi:hypothetical protein